MAKKLKPKAKAYYTYFSDAAAAASRAVSLLATVGESDCDREDVTQEAAECAQQADEYYRTALLALRASFVTPFDRTEIQDLSRELAKAVRHVEAAVSLAVHLELPILPPPAQRIVSLLAQCAELTEEALSKLRKLKGIKHFRSDIAALVTDAYQHHRILLADITSGSIDALLAMKIRAVADELAAAADAFMDVAETVETILITEG